MRSLLAVTAPPANFKVSRSLPPFLTLRLCPSCSLTVVAMTTDETESHQDKPIKQEEVSHEVAPPSPDKEKERAANRSSTGRGLSRLFSSFLNSRSQGDAQGGEKDDKAEEGAKAPIADPEPELKTEGDGAREQTAVSRSESAVVTQRRTTVLMWRHTTWLHFTAADLFYL